VNPSAEAFGYLIEGLSVDTSGPWWEWDWQSTAPWTSYERACLEEFRDSVVLAYRLYNRIGLKHAQQILSGAPPQAAILDAGGGTGRKAIPLAQDGFHIVLLDTAAGWLSLADKQARRAGVRDRLQLIEGDVLDMDCFSQDSFDYVLALGGVVSYCGNPAAALREMGRVLKPGGQLLADGIHSRFGDMRGAARTGDLEALEKLALPSGQPGRVPTLLPEELVSLAQDAGLSQISIGAEFIFMPDDKIRIGPDTPRWEKLVLELEMRYHDDPRFLGTANLLLRATKSV